MGLFSRLFRRREPAAPTPESAAHESPVFAPAPAPQAPQYAIWTPPESTHSLLKKLSEKKDFPISAPPEGKKSRSKAPAQTKLKMKSEPFPQSCEYRLAVPEALAQGITSLGKDNPDYHLDVAKLRRKGYLFEEVYAKRFPPMAAVLTPAPGAENDPDAVKVSVGGVTVGYLCGSAGAVVSQQLAAGIVKRATVEISGGEYLTLDCSAEYDETSKRIPIDELYTMEDEDPYSVDLTVNLAADAQLTALVSTTKVKYVFSGVDTSALPGCKQPRFGVAGAAYRMDDILSLGTRNPDFMAPAEALAEKGLINVPIIEYDFPPMQTELVPEPDNPSDPDAIMVKMNGVKVGYVPARRCRELLEQVRAGQVQRLQGGIRCERYRALIATDAADGSAPPAPRFYREDGDISVKLFLDITDPSK